MLLIEPSADMTLTMPVAGSTVFPAGYTLKIKRNQTYTGTADKITIDASAANASIDGTTTKYMNVGYQSFTVVATSSGWVTID